MYKIQTLFYIFPVILLIEFVSTMDLHLNVTRLFPALHNNLKMLTYKRWGLDPSRLRYTLIFTL